MSTPKKIGMDEKVIMDEQQRLKVLRSNEVLDTESEAAFDDLTLLAFKNLQHANSGC